MSLSISLRVFKFGFFSGRGHTGFEALLLAGPGKHSEVETCVHEVY